MGEGLLLAVEVPAKVFTVERAFIRGVEGGPMVLSLIFGMSAVCVDFPATVVTQKSFHNTSGFPPIPRQLTQITPSPSVFPWLVAVPGPPPNLIFFV